MNKYTKRMLVGGALGALVGILAAYAASMHGIQGAFNVNSAMFWSIVFNRMTLGIIIGMGGIFTVHPIVTSLKVGPILRGIDMGSWISILLATSMLAQGVIGWGLFWWVLIAGALVGSAIDWVLTKRYGEGKQLLDYQA